MWICFQIQEAFHQQQHNMYDTHPMPSVASELKMRGVSFRISILW